MITVIIIHIANIEDEVLVSQELVPGDLPLFLKKSRLAVIFGLRNHVVQVHFSRRPSTKIHR